MESYNTLNIFGMRVDTQQTVPQPKKETSKNRAITLIDVALIARVYYFDITNLER